MLLSLLLLACEPGAIDLADDVRTADADTDTESDTDTDSDADADSDTDSDTDTDADADDTGVLDVDCSAQGSVGLVGLPATAIEGSAFEVTGCLAIDPSPDATSCVYVSDMTLSASTLAPGDVLTVTVGARDDGVEWAGCAIYGYGDHDGAGAGSRESWGAQFEVTAE